MIRLILSTSVLIGHTKVYKQYSSKIQTYFVDETFEQSNVLTWNIIYRSSFSFSMEDKQKIQIITAKLVHSLTQDVAKQTNI